MLKEYPALVEEKKSAREMWARGRGVRDIAVIGVACVCGWFVMELEILGVRVLAPYFGSAVYVVMGSVIGVFLLSLSVGYMLGGYLSRKAASKRDLGLCIMIAGMWMAALPFFTKPVCERIFDMGLDEKWGSLFASLILFGVPTLLLGTVSPTVVRWLTRRASNAGLNTGVVLALSTVASFAGSVVTAFYLILLSVRHTLGVSGVVLLVLGAAILVHAAAHRAPKAGISEVMAQECEDEKEGL
jgi:MFS family permease